jgi:hypothetical protein
LKSNKKFAAFHESCVWIFQRRSLNVGHHTENTIMILDVCLKRYLEKRDQDYEKVIAAKNTNVFHRILLNVGLASADV